VRYTDFEEATQALADGTVDAIFTDLPNAKGITIANPELKIATDPFTNEYYGIVFRKNDPLVGSVNDALSSLRVKGVLTDLKQKWLD
jgi:ABC-type amino acid transport substrate-binding protein